MRRIHTHKQERYRERQTNCEKWSDKETDKMIFINTQTVGDRNRQERKNSFTALLKKVCLNLKNFLQTFNNYFRIGVRQQYNVTNFNSVFNR